MTIAPQWFGLAAAVTFINGATLGFIARRENDRTLRLWAWAWLLWTAAIGPLALERVLSPTLGTLLCGVCWVGSTLCFLGGSHALLDRKLPRAWHVLAVSCLVLAALSSARPGGPLGMLPLVLFQSVGQLVSGILIIRRARGLVGAWLSGAALVALAVHLLDAPLLASTPEWMSWGFVVACALEVMTALGMIMMHYEYARARLLEAERILAETRRMEALGRIAGGVAHDFNNLLTVMQAHIDLLRLDDAVGRHASEPLGALEQTVEQAARLTAQLLSFGRRVVVQPRTVDVREIVQSTLDLLKSVMPAHVRLRFRAQASRYEATLDRALLEQIVLNLVTNARDAVAHAGNVDVELERVDGAEPLARLRVTDDGQGMDETLLAQIFEPFFTTKGSGRGTGLGLASVHGAVSQLRGSIRVRSRPSHGTTFEVDLPLLVPVDVGIRPQVIDGHPEPLKILVVDDDEGVLTTTIKMLQTGGHSVDGARDGARALEMVGNNHYDLVLTDVCMPNVGGLSVMEEVAKLAPAPLVVLASGYPVGNQADLSTMHLIRKPFNRATLLAAIRNAVTESRARQAKESSIGADTLQGAAEV